MAKIDDLGTQELPGDAPVATTDHPKIVFGADAQVGPLKAPEQKMVTIKPRVTQVCRIGPTVWSLEANKTCRVTESVRQILEERNLC